ncbi:MAG: radical SAM protein [Candidatus Omnitrophica bacterium]|nr:radical SAM protein [Candidatus Omnitrophota bacterium]
MELGYSKNSIQENMNVYPDNTPTYARLQRIALAKNFKKLHNIKVGIIVPPSCFVVPNGWEFVHRAPFEGPSVIAAVLKGLGLDVVLLDQRENFNPEFLAGGPLKHLDIVAVATYEDSFPFLKRVVEIAKKEENNRPVILGGPLVSSVPRLIMDNTLADYAVIGEGELTVIELFDFILKRRKALDANEIRGLAWRNSDGQVVINPRRAQIRNLDTVPFQDFSVWPHVQESRVVPEIYMSSSRGCPGHCTFCFRAMPALRYKSPKRVHNELLHLKRFKYRFVWWNDLTFIDSKIRVHKLMTEAFEGIDFRWSCFTRVDGLDLKVLKAMMEHGCDIVMYGFESITKKVLGYFRKSVSKEQIIKAIMLTRKAGIKVGGLFIIGGPGETRASLKRTVDFCKKFKEVTRVKYMSAIPGTILYYDAVKKGIIKDELKHLYFLAKEQSVEDDEILSFTKLPEQELRKVYHGINQLIEMRPYEYCNPVDHYLKEPKNFKKRSLVISS